MNVVGFGQWLCQTPRRAWLLAGLLAPLPFVGWLSAVILSLVTLRRGTRAGIPVVIAASLPFVIWLVTHEISSIYLLLKLLSIPTVWLVASILRATRSWYVTLLSITVLGVVSVCATHLLIADVQVFWQQTITGSLDSMIAHARAQQLDAVVIGLSYYSGLLQQHAVLAYLSSIATGLFVLNALFGVIVQLIAARYWQAKCFNPGGFRGELHALQLPARDNVALAVVSVGAFLGMPVFIDLIPVIILPFMFVAVCILHRYFQAKQYSPMAFYLTCLGLAILSPYSVVFLIAISVFDSIYDLRGHIGFDNSSN